MFSFVDNFFIYAQNGSLRNMAKGVFNLPISLLRCTFNSNKNMVIYHSIYNDLAAYSLF